jgi:ABC-type antimicrobial peptide transport system permease subunit
MQTVRERLFASLGSFFAGVALLLAGVGLYGVLHYSVQQRRREIAIRMAIGAEATNIVRLVTVPLVVTVVSGALAGIMAGLFASRYLSAVFYQVRPTDASMLAIPTTGIIVAGCVAALPATLRALRTDPASTLRAQ